MPRPEAYALRGQILIWVQLLLITDGRITPLRLAHLPALSSLCGPLSSSRFPSLSVSVRS